MQTFGQILAEQLMTWAHQELTATAYLSNGMQYVSDEWYVRPDGLLVARMQPPHLINPEQIVVIHPGPPTRRDGRFRPVD